MKKKINKRKILDSMVSLFYEKVETQVSEPVIQRVFLNLSTERLAQLKDLIFDQITVDEKQN